MAYWFQTTKGVFRIRRKEDRRWHVFFEGEELANYATAQQAATHLAQSRALCTALGDPVERATPADIDEWNREASGS